MKTVKNILSDLRSEPYMRKISHHSCYDKYIRMLPPRFQDAVAFVYVRQEILHIALSHPGYKMELELNKNILLDLLKTLADHDNECSRLEAKKVILFNSRYSIEKVADQDDTVPYYNELSSGEFDLNIDDPVLRKKFEKVRDNIRKNRE